MHTFTTSSLRVARRALAFGSFLAATLVFAGPPMICRSYDIADAKSLPFGSDSHALVASYDRSHLVADTLALLTPDQPVLVRMETMRRAAMYATNGMKDWGKYTKEDRQLAADLLSKLRERAAQAKSDSRALAIFDVGFFAETLRQTSIDPNLDGYPLIAEAAALRTDEPAMAFALALATTSPERRKEHLDHLARARAVAQPGSLLAANIDSHFGRS
jgi:hypothetical protein